MNGSDCGMFTCKYADYITKDKPITFTQVIANHVNLCYVWSSWWWAKMAYKTALLFTETHAVLQKKNGLGDCEPQTVVMSALLVHKVKNRIRLRMAEICSTAGSTERSSVLEMNCTPAHQIQSQLFCYVYALGWSSVDRKQHCLTVLSFVVFRTPMESQSSWNTKCFVLSPPELFLKSCMYWITHHTQNGNVQFDADMQSLHFFLSCREMSILCCIIFMTVITQLGCSCQYLILLCTKENWLKRENRKCHLRHLNGIWYKNFCIWTGDVFFFITNISQEIRLFL